MPLTTEQARAFGARGNRARWGTRRERLLARIRPQETGCWEWDGFHDERGYARVSSDRVHRLTFEEFVGPIPEGLEIDHLCRNPGCVNPGHLEPVTHAENVRRGLGGAYHRSLTECPHGHPYDEANTRVYRGMRYCKRCRVANERDRRARRRAEAAA